MVCCLVPEAERSAVAASRAARRPHLLCGRAVTRGNVVRARADDLDRVA
jgi:hypothetical protein